MKLRQISIYTLFFTTLSMSSCKKMLDHQPDDRTELNSPVKVSELLANAYPHLNYIPFAEAMSDNSFDKGTTTLDRVNEYPWKYMDQVDANTTDNPPSYWMACYKAISAANYALDAINTAGDQSAAAYSASKGEALVARAYAHFMLVTFFAKTYDPATASSDPGIPYVTQAQKVVEGKYERGTVASVYDQIQKDLETGLPLIQNNSYRIPKFHFTTEAAHAFATRFFLFKKDYAKVIEHANAIFPGSTIKDNLRQWNTVYNLLGYYELQATYTKSTEPANLLLQEAATSWGRNYAGYNYGLAGANLLQVIGASGNASGATLAMGDKVFGDDTHYNVPKFTENFVKQTLSATIGEPYNTIPLLTAEEVLFNRAEANIMLNKNPEAITDLDTYLSTRIISYRASVHKFTEAKAKAFSPTVSLQNAMVNAVLSFKKLEYLHEGMRWLDIVRLKIPVLHTSVDGRTTITLAADDPRRVCQLPQEAIASGLAPNPR